MSDSARLLEEARRCEDPVTNMSHAVMARRLVPALAAELQRLREALEPVLAYYRREGFVYGLKAEDEARIAALAGSTAAQCDGSRDCAATTHVHGCFADIGNCDDPNEHPGSTAAREKETT